MVKGEMATDCPGMMNGLCVLRCLGMEDGDCLGLRDGRADFCGGGDGGSGGEGAEEDEGGLHLVVGGRGVEGW